MAASTARAASSTGDVAPRRQRDVARRHLLPFTPGWPVSVPGCWRRVLEVSLAALMLRRVDDFPRSSTPGRRPVRVVTPDRILSFGFVWVAAAPAAAVPAQVQSRQRHDKSGSGETARYESSGRCDWIEQAYCGAWLGSASTRVLIPLRAPVAHWKTPDFRTVGRGSSPAWRAKTELRAQVRSLKVEVQSSFQRNPFGHPTQLDRAAGSGA